MLKTDELLVVQEMTKSVLTVFISAEKADEKI
jgi:hypothetical protein